MWRVYVSRVLVSCVGINPTLKLKNTEPENTLARSTELTIQLAKSGLKENQ